MNVHCQNYGKTSSVLLLTHDVSCVYASMSDVEPCIDIISRSCRVYCIMLRHGVVTALYTCVV